eukprot:s4_g33.t1
MSAGVYALMGMHYADVIMNWGQMEYRYGKSALLLVLILIDSIAAMVSEFSGGWLSGMLMGVLVGRNLKVHDFEHYFQAVAFVILLVIVIFSAVWLSGWPPRTIFQAEQDAWCWVRQVYNTSLFQSNNWQCGDAKVHRAGFGRRVFCKPVAVFLVAELKVQGMLLAPPACLFAHIRDSTAFPCQAPHAAVVLGAAQFQSPSA